MWKDGSVSLLNAMARMGGCLMVKISLKPLALNFFKI